MAPQVVSGALKRAQYIFANLYEHFGFKVRPNGLEDRYDIIQAVTLNSPEAVIAFVKVFKCRSCETALLLLYLGQCRDIIVK